MKRVWREKGQACGQVLEWPAGALYTVWTLQERIAFGELELEGEQDAE
jgi:hypothetical protein